MKETATGNGEAQTRYDTKRSGAVKVHALGAPPLGNGSDGLFIFPCLGFFLLNGLLGKLLDKGKPKATALTCGLQETLQEKFASLVDPELLAEDNMARFYQLDDAWEWLERLIG